MYRFKWPAEIIRLRKESIEGTFSVATLVAGLRFKLLARTTSAMFKMSLLSVFYIHEALVRKEDEENVPKFRPFSVLSGLIVADPGEPKRSTPISLPRFRKQPIPSFAFLWLHSAHPCSLGFPVECSLQVPGVKKPRGTQKWAISETLACTRSSADAFGLNKLYCALLQCILVVPWTLLHLANLVDC